MISHSQLKSQDMSPLQLLTIRKDINTDYVPKDAWISSKLRNTGGDVAARRKHEGKK
jgi:hypothetical protein